MRSSSTPRCARRSSTAWRASSGRASAAARPPRRTCCARLGNTIPNSVSSARSRLMVAVRSSIHPWRTRCSERWIEERTATINRLRALLTEFGVVLPNRAQHVRRGARAAAEALPELARQAVEDLRAHLGVLDERITAYDRELEAQARASEAAQRLMQIRGIGPLTAVAMVATVGCARDFRSGRQFAAWLGLTPRQHSSGGKPRLGHISRRGDAYLRCLLVQGARSVLLTAMRHSDRMSRWAVSLQARCGYHKALVAIAAKNARIAWALLSKNQTLQTA